MRYLRYLTIILTLIAATTVFADDSSMFRKNVSRTPDLETEHAAIRMLPLYIPAQASDGTLLEEDIVYYDADEAEVGETRAYARPLITHYNDGHVDVIEEEGYGGFPGHGHRDAWGAVSLDDGATWNRTNLSQSGELSSIRIKDGKKWVDYPGDVLRTFIASDGNQVLVVWVSKYTRGGSPNYAMTDDERRALETHFGFAENTCTDLFNDDGSINDISTPCLYMEDYFGVAGSQGIQSAEELAEDGYPLVGDYPFSAVWAARGVILPPAAEGESSTFVWFKAERLSSGVRDANRPEAVCVKGAGCVVTWQEDPEGIRPGHGDGPGEGWSGAIAHHQTDTWYSYIDWDDFALVGDDSDEDGIIEYGSFYNTTGNLSDWIAANTVDDKLSGSPQAAIPMSIPMRLTDNAMCTASDVNGTATAEEDPYCYADFNSNETADFCASAVIVTIETPEGPTQDVYMCIAEDGRLMRGTTASTRARLGLHGYSTQGDYREDSSTYPIDSAWVYMAYEENKGLGDICDDGDCLDEATSDADKIDMGKNVWYHTFDMFNPEVVSQGLMLNQPAVYQEDFTNPSSSDPDSIIDSLTQYDDLGYNFYQIDPDPVYETLAGIDTTILLQSEIARRPSPISQDWYDAGTHRTVAFQLWKQGIIRRGGPADIMGRRFVMPLPCTVNENGKLVDDGTCFNAAEDNPYDYANMVCENADGSSAWAFIDGSNPRYVKGLCAAPAINLSGNTILEGECGDATACLDAFPFNDYFDGLDMTTDPDNDGTTGIVKILSWQQYGPGFDQTITDTTLTNLDDQSWENPYDMAKGHRGFMAGDMIMAMYAWTPNWNDLTNAHSIVNLYIRRSFDGGQTWSTLPASFEHTNDITYGGKGTTTCEWMGPIAEQYPVCVDYAAGEFEQARNVSQLLGSQVTVLDPRYTPTTRSITEASVSTTSSLPAGFIAPLYDDDVRDPSRFFMVYETGHTSAYDAGEATPLDLFYSRAVSWGDHYLVWTEETDLSTALPSADTEDEWDLSDFCNEFDAIEGSKLDESGEASVIASPGGQFFYSVWNQWDFDQDGNEIGADAWFRRILFLDDYVPGVDNGDPTDDAEDPVEDPTPDPPQPGKGRTSTVDTTTSTTDTTAVVVKGKKGR